MAEQHNITLAPATAADAPFVASIFMEAMLTHIMEEKREPETFMIEIARREDTLYSWKNTTLAFVDGVPAGGIIGYPGEHYHETRVLTFGLWTDDKPLSFDPDKMEDECGPGEYYLDSMAVRPEYRKMGIASKLLHHGAAEAHRLGLRPTFLCDPENETALRLYLELGFHQEGTRYAFGHDYLRMTD